MRSRKRLLLSTTVLVTALTAGTADAAPPSGAQKPQSSSSQFALRREEAGGVDATAARQRARAGDCAGALPAFDAAIRVTIEPTLRRDRGLCHEKLGDPFPAIEDYRAYLVARPDAPDADQIRDRLSRLEESVGVGAPSAASFRERDESLHAGGSFSLGTQGGKVSGSSGASSTRERAHRESEPLGPRAGEQERSYDYYATQERLADAAESSPLRYGTGWIVAPFLMLPRYFVGGSSSTPSGIGAFSTSASRSDLAYGIGASIRYAWSSSMTFLAEVGYGGIGETGASSSSGGPLVFVGVEGRVPLDKWSSNQLVLGIGPGYEHYTFAGSKQTTNIVDARARFGFRHIFGPSIGLELLVDGGPAYRKREGTAGEVVGVVGGMFALSIGF
jgi:hypothetical protein